VRSPAQPFHVIPAKAGIHADFDVRCRGQKKKNGSRKDAKARRVRVSGVSRLEQLIVSLGRAEGSADVGHQARPLRVFASLREQNAASPQWKRESKRTLCLSWSHEKKKLDPRFRGDDEKK
jgi:hypothetical protein